MLPKILFSFNLLLFPVNQNSYFEFCWEVKMLACHRLIGFSDKFTLFSLTEHTEVFSRKN